MEGSKLTEEQIKSFCEMIHKAFEEIRSLSWVGFSEQAGALADAFHNLPIYLFSPNFEWETARLFIGAYQREYPRSLRNNTVTGSYYDYLSILDDIQKLK